MSNVLFCSLKNEARKQKAKDKNNSEIAITKQNTSSENTTKTNVKTKDKSDN